MGDITVRQYLDTGRKLSGAYRGMKLNDVMVHDSGGKYHPKLFRVAPMEKDANAVECQCPRPEDFLKF